MGKDMVETRLFFPFFPAMPLLSPPRDKSTKTKAKMKDEKRVVHYLMCVAKCFKVEEIPKANTSSSDQRERNVKFNAGAKMETEWAQEWWKLFNEAAQGFFFRRCSNQS